MITIDDFRKLELVTGTVTEANEHPNADKLYVVTVDIGDEKRQLVAGIRQFYSKEELIGKRVIVVKNLETAVIRGIESNGMILAAKDGANLALLVPEKEVATGSRVS
ncbi:MAG: hypothetical protein ABH885_01225 [Candidatus Omnitrophota bacterium]